MDADGNLCYTEERLSANQKCTQDPGLFVINEVTRDYVNVTVTHTIKDGRGDLVDTLNWMAVHYIENGEATCPKELFFDVYKVFNIQAECICGVAEIDVFAYSAAFSRRKDKAVIPAVCNDYCNCVGKRCGWRYRVPCGDGPVPSQMPPACPVGRRLLGEEVVVDKFAAELLSPMDVEPANNFECISVWAYDRSNAWCLGQLQNGKLGWTNRMTVPVEPVSLDLHAYQDGCRDVGFPVGKLFVSYEDGKMFANYTVEDGFEIHQTNMHVAGRRRLPKRRVNGVKEEVFDPELFPFGHSHIRTESDTFLVDIDQDRVYLAGHAIVCGDFKAKEAELEATAAAHEASLSCLDELEVANEDFEDGVVDGWSSGILSYDASINRHFLGKLDNAVPVFKDFTIPDGAEEVVIHFTVLGFGHWDPDDVFFFKLWRGKHLVPLEHVPMLLQGPSDDLISIDSFTVNLPRDILRLGGKLQIGFEVQWAHQSLKNSGPLIKSVGVDSIAITAVGQICHSTKDVPEAASGFAHSKLAAPPLASPEKANDIDGYYCLVEDFPCSPDAWTGKDRVDDNFKIGKETMDRMVQVCHYSTDRGYVSYCIPEQDSDMIRFYKNDYCGACTGGYKVPSR